ncbi:tetraspanin-32 [Pyxicephalus adspersus]|uniref:tetraspanin-32 n=1 Tax=Pyxicephalus adspersus TaxID=30357 RepID=UPI003B59B983
MGHQILVRVARCQLLVSCLFILLLAVAFCFVTVITVLSPHFTILIGASPSGSHIRDLHHAMILYGSSVSVLLLLTVLVSVASVHRESQTLMATAFIGFGFLFCILMAGLTWTQECKSQVEASFLDVYDNIYDQVLRRANEEARKQLVQTHDIFQCCGKTGGHLNLPDNHNFCKSRKEEQDCVSTISSSLHIHLHWVRLLLLLSLGFTVYGMVLTSFLYFSLPRGNIWGRRGEYSPNNPLICHPGTTQDTPLSQLLPYHSTQ